LKLGVNRVGPEESSGRVDFPAYGR
jgi:hypothetical protein